MLLTLLLDPPLLVGSDDLMASLGRVVLVLLLIGLGVRCWSAYISMQIEERGDQASQQAAETSFIGRLLCFMAGLGILLIICL